MYWFIIFNEGKLNDEGLVYSYLWGIKCLSIIFCYLNYVWKKFFKVNCMEIYDESKGNGKYNERIWEYEDIYLL